MEEDINVNLWLPHHLQGHKHMYKDIESGGGGVGMDCNCGKERNLNIVVA